MPEEGRPCPWVRWSGTAFQRQWPWLLLVVFITVFCCWFHCSGLLSKQQQRLLEHPEVRGGEKALKHKQRTRTGRGAGWGARKIGMRWIVKRKMRQREDRRGRLWRPGRSQLPRSRRGIPDWERCHLERPGGFGSPTFPTMPEIDAHVVGGLPSWC